MKTTLENMTEELVHDTSPYQSTFTGIIFRRTVRFPYASLDLIDNENHTIAVISFHEIKDGLAQVRSYIRRECKIGTLVELNGTFENNKKIMVTLKSKPSSSLNDNSVKEYINLSIIQRQKMKLVDCQRIREKYYPTVHENGMKSFEMTKNTTEISSSIDNNRNNIKASVHPVIKKSVDRSNNNKESSGHGSGVSKLQQAEIFKDFVLALISRHLRESDVSNDQLPPNSKTTSLNVPGEVPECIRDRYVDIPPVQSLSTRNLGKSLDTSDTKKVVDFLNTGTGVMDVAGGSGHVSLAFSLNGVQSTVIDPREHVGRLPNKERKIHRKALSASWRNQALNGTSDFPQPVEFSALRAWFAKRPDGVHTEFRETGPDTENSIPVCSMTSADNLLPRCSAVVALHPDEATGDIVDFAVAHGLPFVVVPCCVFSRLFPTRLKPLRTGEDGGKRQVVSTYDDLIGYLCDKHESIRVSKLGFSGANLALWSMFTDKSNE